MLQIHDIRESRVYQEAREEAISRIGPPFTRSLNCPCGWSLWAMIDERLAAGYILME